MTRARATVAVVSVGVEGTSVEVSANVSTAISQAIHAVISAVADDDAILAACRAVPDTAVGLYAATPGDVWEPVRRAIARARGIPATLDEARAAEREASK